jgi:transposase
MTLSTTIEHNRAVFAGIDFHKRFSVVTLGDAGGKPLFQEKLLNDEHSIRKFFLQNAPLKCAIENCRGNEWFIELLKHCGCEVKVSNTYAVRLIADSKCKNDKIDSQILMELLAKDYLPTCYQPTLEERKLKEHLRWRTKLMRSRTQYKNTAHALMDKENKGTSLKSRKQRSEIPEGQVSIERHDLPPKK